MRHQIRLVTVLACLTVAGTAATVHAQPSDASPSTELKLVTGYTGFIDEMMIGHFVAGAALRFALWPRTAAEVEVLHMNGPGEDSALTVVPTLSFALRRDGRAVPYVVGGAGWLSTTLPVGTGLYSSSSWSVGGGGGVRFALTPRTSLSVEARLGTEPFTRLTAAVGVRLR